MEKIIQQGDVILKQRKSLPKDAKPISPTARGYILAEGEATDHAHVIRASKNVRGYEINGTMWLEVLAPEPLTHEEHEEQTINPAIWEIGKVKEVDPFTEEINSVKD